METPGQLVKQSLQLASPRTRWHPKLGNQRTLSSDGSRSHCRICDYGCDVSVFASSQDEYAAAFNSLSDSASSRARSLTSSKSFASSQRSSRPAVARPRPAVEHDHHAIGDRADGRFDSGSNRWNTNPVVPRPRRYRMFMSDIRSRGSRGSDWRSAQGPVRYRRIPAGLGLEGCLLRVGSLVGPDYVSRGDRSSREFDATEPLQLSPYDERPIKVSARRGSRLPAAPPSLLARYSGPSLTADRTAFGAQTLTAAADRLGAHLRGEQS
jgi:hypothetical protein